MLQGSTPVSIAGPNCSGSLLRLSHSRRYPAVTAALLGVQAMSMWPFARRQPWREQDAVDAGPEPGTGPAPPPEFCERFESRACRLCGVGTESVYHVACECRDARLAAVQQATAASMRRLLASAHGAAKGILRSPSDPRPLAGAPDAAALACFLDGGGAADPDEGRILVYWPLLGVPWPASSAAPQHRAVRALGATFDALNVQPRELRGWAAAWLQQSESALRALGAAWQAAAVAAATAPTHPPPGAQCAYKIR